MTGDWTEDVNRIADASTTEIYDRSGAFRQQATSEHSINRHSSGLIRVSSDSNMAAWAYARYSFLFFIALLVTWVRQIF
jgi:hypothetical protein